MEDRSKRSVIPTNHKIIHSMHQKFTIDEDHESVDPIGEFGKKLEADLELFHNSVDRVASVSSDKKDGVRFSLSKNKLDLSVNNANSGDGKETLSVNFDHDLEISFNSKYLVDVSSQLEGENIEIFFNDISSPALIKDPSDFDSIYVIMPMKG